MSALTAAPPPAPPAERPSDDRRLAVAVLALTALVTVLLIAFAWPATRATVHDVPLGVAGPPAAVQRVEAELAAARPGAFEVLRYADEAAARAAIRHREVYGAVLAGPGGPAVLTASAASATVAQALTQLAGALPATPGSPVRVVDVAPAPAADPRGAGLAAGTLPLALGGIAAAGLLTALIRSRWARIAGAVLFAAVGGAALAAVLQLWIGAVDGPYLAVAGVVALVLAAVSLSLLGLGSLLGRAGLAVGAGIVVALGNPLSGATSAPEMLPDGWGLLGQLLPPGAGISLLRSVAFFDGGAGRPLAVLLCWAAAGLLLAAGAGLRPRRGPDPGVS